MAIATHEEIEALIDKAGFAIANKRFERAFELLEKAQERSQASNDLPSLVTALLQLSDLHHEMGNFDDALQESERAVAIARSLSDPLLLADALRHLGDMNKDLLRSEDALTCLDEAMHLLQKHPQRPDKLLADTLRPMAMLMERLNQRQQAIDCWSRAGQLYRNINHAHDAQECSRHLSRLQ